MSYSTGTIYKIICRTNSDIVYIGSTFNSLRNRWQCHKGFYKEYLKGTERTGIAIYSYFEKYGIENFKIIKVKEYECYRANRADYKHLQAYEQLWINKTKDCVNKVNPFCITKLSRKQYKTNNKEKILEQEKTRYRNNREKIKERVRNYAKNNKEEIRERGKIYREKNKEQIRENKAKPKFCIICKSNTTNSHFKRHTSSQKHIRNAAYTIKEFIVSKSRK